MQNNVHATLIVHDVQSSARYLTFSQSLQLFRLDVDYETQVVRRADMCSSSFLDTCIIISRVAYQYQIMKTGLRNITLACAQRYDHATTVTM